MDHGVQDINIIGNATASSNPLGNQKESAPELKRLFRARIPAPVIRTFYSEDYSGSGAWSLGQISHGSTQLSSLGSSPSPRSTSPPRQRSVQIWLDLNEPSTYEDKDDWYHALQVLQRESWVGLDSSRLTKLDLNLEMPIPDGIHRKQAPIHPIIKAVSEPEQSPAGHELQWCRSEEYNDAVNVRPKSEEYLDRAQCIELASSDPCKIDSKEEHNYEKDLKLDVHTAMELPELETYSDRELLGRLRPSQLEDGPVGGNYGLKVGNEKLRQVEGLGSTELKHSISSAHDSGNILSTTNEHQDFSDGDNLMISPEPSNSVLSQHSVGWIVSKEALLCGL